MYLIDNESTFKYLNSLVEENSIAKELFFEKIKKNEQSYWLEQPSNEVGACKYGFKTLAELEIMLKERIPQYEPALHQMAIDAFRKRRDYEASKETKNTEMTIPDYVYTF